MPVHPLLAAARTTGNPIVEGKTATFIWQGTPAPNIIDDSHNWDDSPQKMRRTATGLWSLTLEFPSDAYVEYAFTDPKSGKRILDPLNPRRIKSGGNLYNHYFYMPHGNPSPQIHKQQDIAKGRVTKYSVPTQEFTSSVNRTVYLYRPPVQSPVPLLIVYDGSDYLHKAKLNVIIDNLINEKRIRPIAMAMIKNGGPSRTVEYSCSESTLSLLTECILPFVNDQLDLEPISKGRYGIMGASLGGSMALFTAMRQPKIFRKVISQSGAFIAPDYQSVIVDLICYAPRPEIDIWMDTGRLEWLLDGNRQMYALLKDKSYHVIYREFSGGHNFTSWRNDITFGLEALYK